jgi:hypothetical protein
MFVGASTPGSYYLALRYVARRYDIEAGDDLILRRAYELAENDGDRKLHECVDRGNAGVTAVSIDFGEYRWGWKEEERKSLAETLFVREE